MNWSVLLLLVSGYSVFVAWRLGAHRRVPLILRRISLDEIPARAAATHGERALFTTDEPCSWTVPALAHSYPDPRAWSATRITRTAGFIAGMLHHRCFVQHGDRVAIMKTNHLDMHVIMCGIVRAGGIACPINGKFAADKLSPYLRHIGARVLVTDLLTLDRLVAAGADFGSIERMIVADPRPVDSIAEQAGADLERTSPGCELLWIEEAVAAVEEEAQAVSRNSDEVLYLVHSSGTTGFPKAVALKNGPQSHAVRGWLSYVHLSPARDKGYLAVPNNHQAVILTFNSLLLLGLPAHWTGAYDRDGFAPLKVRAELEAGAFTGFFGFPVTYTLLKESSSLFPLRRMRFWATTADASHEAIVNRFVVDGSLFRSFGIPLSGAVFLDAQGSSEVGTPSVLRYVTRFTRRFQRRVGRPGSTPFGPRIRIRSAEGEDVPAGEAGRLEVNGRTLFAGYWNDPDLTATAFRDGWFFTGDVARFDRDGHVIQLDREVDVVHTVEGDVFTLLIEEEVHKHPAVFDACVYAFRQQDGSQRPAAWVAIREGYSIEPAGLMDEINLRLPEMSRLGCVDVRPWSSFPMGITGKTLKRVLSDATEPTSMPERNRPPSQRPSSAA